MIFRGDTTAPSNNSGDNDEMLVVTIFMVKTNG